MIENNVTEFKRTFVEDIKYAVVAFANTDGGTVYIGIDDNGDIRGIENIDDIMLRITNMIRDTIRPDVTMFVNMSVEEIDNKKIIVLNIQRGTARPYYLAKKGVCPEGVYVRQGASSVPASETAILSMIKETSGDRYEDARALNQELTFKKATEYFQKKNIDFSETQMRTLGIINKDSTYSNLGMLLSDQCVHTIKIAVFEGSKKTIFHDRKEITGSLLEQLEDASAYINQYNRTRSEFEGLYRIDIRDYPAEALREALLNALVHRDYSISGSTLISIFDDRIEFLTLGGLIRGITYEDIMIGVSALRNQHLANIFYRLRLIEAYGTGMVKIKECYTNYEVKPKIDITDNAFKITLPNINYIKEHSTLHTQDGFVKTEKSSERENDIVKLFENRDSIVRKDVETGLNVSQATAILDLREMVNKGMLLKEGSGKNTRYRLKK